MNLISEESAFFKNNCESSNYYLHKEFFYYLFFNRAIYAPLLESRSLRNNIKGYAYRRSGMLRLASETRSVVVESLIHLLRFASPKLVLRFASPKLVAVTPRYQLRRQCTTTMLSFYSLAKLKSSFNQKFIQSKDLTQKHSNSLSHPLRWRRYYMTGTSFGDAKRSNNPSNHLRLRSFASSATYLRRVSIQANNTTFSQHTSTSHRELRKTTTFDTGDYVDRRYPSKHRTLNRRFITFGEYTRSYVLLRIYLRSYLNLRFISTYPSMTLRRPKVEAHVSLPSTTGSRISDLSLRSHVVASSKQNLSNQRSKQKNNKNLLVSFSGGQDSVTLLVLLFGIQSQNSLKLNILFFHHLWHKDSFFVTRHIFKLSLLFKISIHNAVAITPVKTELQARQWRLKLSRRLESFYKYQRVIQAHSGTDKIETLLLNLFRGTGNISPFYSTNFSLNFSQTQKRKLSFSSMSPYA